VLEAINGPIAMQFLASDPCIDLIFTDVVLPGEITGADIVREARHLKPTIKPLFTPGYSRNAIVHHGRLNKGVELLSKPFSFEELAAKTRDILDRTQ
jgi:response regulator RpfG family c-di-GMP phosphodiesterase